MTLLLYVNNGRFPRRLSLIEEVEPPSGFVNKQLIINWSMLRLHFAARREVKVARYSFSGPIPSKFEHKLRRHKQSFGKIATTVV